MGQIALQRKLAASVPGRTLSILTQNIDRLHQASGSVNVSELHGSLWLVKPENHKGFLEEPGKVRYETLGLTVCGRGLRIADDMRWVVVWVCRCGRTVVCRWRHASRAAASLTRTSRPVTSR